MSLLRAVVPRPSLTLFVKAYAVVGFDSPPIDSQSSPWMGARTLGSLIMRLICSYLSYFYILLVRVYSRFLSRSMSQHKIGTNLNVRRPVARRQSLNSETISGSPFFFPCQLAGFKVAFEEQFLVS